MGCTGLNIKESWLSSGSWSWGGVNWKATLVDGTHCSVGKIKIGIYAETGRDQRTSVHHLFKGQIWLSNHGYILSELCVQSVQSLLNIMLTGDHQCQPLSLHREKNSLVLELNWSTYWANLVTIYSTTHFCLNDVTCKLCSKALNLTVSDSNLRLSWCDSVHLDAFTIELLKLTLKYFL